MKKTTFYLIRHGETEKNRALVIQGHGDSPLSEEGERQARVRAEVLTDIHFDQAFCSDLLRARRTAEIILYNRSVALESTEALRERYFGSYEGRSIHDFLNENEALIHQFNTLSDDERWQFQLLGNVETNKSAVQRAFTFLQHAANRHAGKTVLAVTHAGIMRLLLIHLGWGMHEEMPWGTLANCSLIRLENDGGRFVVQETDGIIRSTERRPVHVIL